MSALIGSLILAACGSGSGAKAAVSTQDGKITVKGSGTDAAVTISGENNTKVTFDQGQVPSNFPADIPRPNGPLIQTVAAGGPATRPSFNLNYTFSPRPPADVLRDYRRQLESAGFSVGGSQDLGGSTNTVTGFEARDKKWQLVAWAIGGGTNGTGVFTLVITHT